MVDDIPEEADQDLADETEEPTDDWETDEEADEPAKQKKKKKCNYEPYCFPQTEPHALTRIELEAVTKLIMEKNPRWWRAFYLKEVWGAGREEVAAELDVEPSRVYQLVDVVKAIGQKYKRENR